MIALRVAWLVWLALTMFPTVSHGGERAVGAIVRSRLVEVPVLRCRFEQTKHLQGFRNPLVSAGTVLFARDRGVVWNTTAPFASTVVLTRSAVVTRSLDGTSRIEVGPATSPGLVTANALMMALIGGDIEALSKRFEMVESLAEDGSWRLQLLPKSEPLSQLFERIELRGDHFMRGVSLAEGNGDRTEIRFLDPYDTSDPLTEAEVMQFD